MKPKELPTTEYLRSKFIYNPLSGSLFYIDKPNSIVGTKDKGGYLTVQLKAQVYRVHRLVWQLFYGDLTPDSQIDHINGERADNRIVNLRKVTNLENHRNRKKSVRNTTGYAGVSIYKADGKVRFRASIRNKGKLISLGLYDSAEAAYQTRLRANKEYGYHPNHGRL